MRQPKRSPGRSGAAWLKVSAQVKAEEPDCAYCGKVLRYDVPVGHPDRGTVDHIVPLSQGGHPLERTNLTACCSFCQGSKGNRTPEQWAASKQVYSYESPLRLA